MMQTVTRLQRIQYITQQYQRLQGLRLVPIGLGALLFSLVSLASPLPQQRGWTVAMSVFVVVTLGGQRLVARYYQRSFGDVVPNEPVSVGEAYVTGISPASISVETRVLIGVCALVVGVGTAIAGVPLYPVFVLLSVAWAIGMAAYLQRSGTLPARLYWVAGMALIVLTSLVLALPIPTFASLHTISGSFVFFSLSLIPSGLVLLVCGLLDHRLLVRSFGSITEENGGTAV